MNRATKSLWRRRLEYRRKRLVAARRARNKKRVYKWSKLVQQASIKLGLSHPKAPVPTRDKKPVVPKTPAKKPVVLNHPTNKSEHKKGIDVSVHNGSVEWAKVKAAGIDYAFCKTSEGGDWEDSTWTSARVTAMRKAGVQVGVYHYLRPRRDRSGAEEMKFFMKQAQSAGWGKEGDLRPVIDFEENGDLSGGKVLAYLSSAVDELKAITGKTPIIYTGGPFWDANTNSYSNNFGCPLWLAAYVTNPDKYLPAAWNHAGWAIWQHTDRGPVSGVSTDNVDQNISKQLPSL